MRKDYRLETTYAVGLLTVKRTSFTVGKAFGSDNCRIIETASIFKWMIGKDLLYVTNYLKRKGQFVSLLAM